MTGKQFCTEGTWDGDVIPHQTLWKERNGYPKIGELYVGSDDLTYEATVEDPYDRHEGKTTVYKVKQTIAPGVKCPDCGTTVCGTCGYGVDNQGVPNDDCCIKKGSQ